MCVCVCVCIASVQCISYIRVVHIYIYVYVSIGAPGIAAKVYYKVKGERKNNFSHVVNCEKIIYTYIYIPREGEIAYQEVKQRRPPCT
jgi:hypothetical protein